MKNVTITLPDDVLARARVEAAKQAKSLSRFVADAVVEKMGATDDPAVALDRFLSGPGYPGIAANLPTREELYAEREEELLRRYESHRLRDGPGGASEATERRGLAEEPEQDPYAGPQSAKPE
ncbi:MULTISPECIES: hypothetical protein [Rhodoplanes]|jgi:hypothetical protein|uniref:CopG family transcriptional regulator n=1 Tax=Rhodoplanes serenus TaxID=200615 RepID=A0A447CYJ7_9BRAD|nr:hypothetical protein [Rhodoplanes serenus]VCU10376.1 hypothetical protein RHODGE_RHODGE_03566 [Rhodoplanes serenus]